MSQKDNYEASDQHDVKVSLLEHATNIGLIGMFGLGGFAEVFQSIDPGKATGIIAGLGSMAFAGIIAFDRK